MDKTMTTQPPDSPKPPMICGPCNKEFAGIKEIKRHMETEHPIELLDDIQASDGDLRAQLVELVRPYTNILISVIENYHKGITVQPINPNNINLLDALDNFITAQQKALIERIEKVLPEKQMNGRKADGFYDGEYPRQRKYIDSPTIKDDGFNQAIGQVQAILTKEKEQL